MRKISQMFLYALPVLLMIGLIPLIKNEYLLTLAYLTIILVAFALKRAPHEVVIFVSGLVIMTASEYLFVSTGVETFTQQSLFGIMPLWLPFLWGYGFVAIKRSVELL